MDDLVEVDRDHLVPNCEVGRLQKHLPGATSSTLSLEVEAKLSKARRSTSRNLLTTAET